jgi:hypothetical protein
MPRDTFEGTHSVATLIQHRIPLQGLHLRVHSCHTNASHNADAGRTMEDPKIELLKLWQREGRNLFLLEGGVYLTLPRLNSFQTILK